MIHCKDVRVRVVNEALIWQLTSDNFYRARKFIPALSLSVVPVPDQCIVAGTVTPERVRMDLKEGPSPISHCRLPRCGVITASCKQVVN